MSATTFYMVGDDQDKELFQQFITCMRTNGALVIEKDEDEEVMVKQLKDAPSTIEAVVVNTQFADIEGSSSLFEEDEVHWVVVYLDKEMTKEESDTLCDLWSNCYNNAGTVCIRRDETMEQFVNSIL